MSALARKSWEVVSLVLLYPAIAHAATYYVAPNGSDANPGTEMQPFATMEKAQATVLAGDTVYFRGGTYLYTSATAANGVLLDKSGKAGSRINYFAYPSEVPVFDFSGMTAMARITGFRVTASYLHMKGLELKGVPQNITTANESWGIHIVGNNSVFENLNLHHIQGPGLFIAGTGSDNQVINCDSHHNYDPKSSAGDGENADGFGCHGGGGNLFSGCRAWWNTDDGFDFISAKGVCVVENSWAFYNGYVPDTFTSKGNGNGIKAGGYGVPADNVPSPIPRHIVRLCVAFRNKAAGFYANHHPIGGDWFSNSGYRNARDFDMLVLEGGTPDHKLRNNFGYGSSSTLANFTGTDDSFNSWTTGVTISDADFLSIDFVGMDGPRQPDGRLPNVPFLKLQKGSDLIDKGQDVGFPFAGAAPDLGAFETGLPEDAGTGSGGAAGSSGAAGAAGRDGGGSGGAAGGGSIDGGGAAGRGGAGSTLDAGVSDRSATTDGSAGGTSGAGGMSGDSGTGGSTTTGGNAGANGSGGANTAGSGGTGSGGARDDASGGSSGARDAGEADRAAGSGGAAGPSAGGCDCRAGAAKRRAGGQAGSLLFFALAVAGLRRRRSSRGS